MPCILKSAERCCSLKNKKKPRQQSFVAFVVKPHTSMTGFLILSNCCLFLFWFLLWRNAHFISRTIGHYYIAFANMRSFSTFTVVSNKLKSTSLLNKCKPSTSSFCAPGTYYTHVSSINFLYCQCISFTLH